MKTVVVYLSEVLVITAAVSVFTSAFVWMIREIIPLISR